MSRARAPIAIALALLLAAPAAAQGAASRATQLRLAEQGVARAQSAWRDRRRHWYDERLNDHDRFPLATIWGAVPLFEAIDGVALADPSSHNRRAVAAFAHGAERYFDRSLRPHGGYAPYPGDRGQVQAWFDDNGWWGLAFFDAFRATHKSRYLRDAERGFAYGAAAGWDRSAGGLWWNTSHPYKAGEALASHTLLGALLYRQTHRSSYLRQVEKYIAWADAHFTSDGLYRRSNLDPTPIPYIEGPMIEAHEVLCRATGDNSWCDRAGVLADRAAARFQTLHTSPQTDTIYLRTMLAYGHDAHDSRWRALAEDVASRAAAHASTGRGLYLRDWNGSSNIPQAVPGMLRTDAATVSLFAWLAAIPAT